MGIFELTLGIVSSMGGFIDLGELVFLSQAGASFLYSLLWVVVLGTIGIVVYGEMAGRVAAVTGAATFAAVRAKLPFGMGTLALIASFLVTLITCAAEVGGMGLILQLAFNWPFALSALAAALLVLLLILFVPFPWLEKSLGILGLFMLVFLAAVFVIDVPWGSVAAGLVPRLAPHHPWLYAYFATSIFTAVMMPYELVFYSSGAIEQKWDTKQIRTNRFVTALGFSLGSVVAIAILVNAAVLFSPQGIAPQLLGTTALSAAFPFGRTGVYLALLGMWFAILGAAVETALSGAYSVAQFFNRPWGKERPFKEAKVFYVIMVGVTLVAGLFALVGPSPIQLAEYAVVFSALALPLTYLATLLMARDVTIMGANVNGKLANTLGWFFLALVTLVAALAVPLMILTSTGQIW